MLAASLPWEAASRRRVELNSSTSTLHDLMQHALIVEEQRLAGSDGHS